MRKIAFALVCLALCLVCSAPLLAFAGELRIYDARGVLRSVKPVEKSASVTVRIVSSIPITRLSLASTSGLAADVVGQPSSEKTFEFKEVTEGSWRIVAASPDVQVSRIDVQP